MYRELNPYNRTLQKSIKKTTDNIKDRIYEYRAMGQGDLGYGYSGEVEYIFITGATDIEKGFPKFTLPIVDLTSRRPTIMVDMRPYALSKLTSIENKLEDMLLKKTSYSLPLMSALMLGDSIEGNVLLKSEWYKSYSFILTNALVNELSLDPYDRTSLHVTILAYMVDNLDRNREVSARDFIIVNNMLLNGLRVDTSDIQEITANLQRTDLDINVLIENINICSEDRRLKTLTLDIVIGALNKLVFAKDGAYIVNGLEYPELFMPLLHTYTTNTFMKRTKLVESFKYISRKLDTKDMNRALENIIK